MPVKLKHCFELTCENSNDLNLHTRKE